jgi:hypothetical protein
MRHIECPQSAPASNDIQFDRIEDGLSAGPNHIRRLPQNPSGPRGKAVRTIVIDLSLADVLQKNFDGGFRGQDVVFNRINGTQNTIDGSGFARAGRPAQN